MENNNKSTQKIVIGAIFLLLLGGLAGYMFYQKTELEESNTFLEAEKISIEKSLDEMIKKYDVAIDDNSALSNELKSEREDIAILRDSVKNLEKANYSIVRRYRAKIEELEKSNQELFKQNDSLRIINVFLEEELIVAEDIIEEQTAIMQAINEKNAELTELVAVGAQLRVSRIGAKALKKRMFGGKMVETERANRSDMLRINFTIAENELAEKSEQMAYIQLLDPKGNVINSTGNVVLSDGIGVDYTDQASVDYNNVNLDVISVVDVDRKVMEEGTYTVSVFMEGRLAAISGFVLK